MSKAAMHLAVGAGAVLLAYLAYKQLGTKGAASIRPTNPGGGFTSVAPGEYLSTDQMIYGAATSSPYDTYATTDDLIKGVVYGTNRSIIRQGAW
jgi:hypothetical protein